MKTLLFVFALLIPSAALADVPPPEDYVESCTVQKQTVAGLECKSCAANHGAPDACATTLGKDGYRKMCKSYGASVWDEVWCKGEPTAPAATTPAETPADAAPKKTGCDAGEASGALGALGALAIALGRRSRRIAGTR